MNIDPKKYSKTAYNFDVVKLKELEKLNYKKPLIDFLVLLFTIILLSKVSINIITFNYFFIIPITFVIAGRQGVILQFMHECAHNLISPDRKINTYFGKFLGLLIGLDFIEYKNTHRTHHGNASTINEPTTDQEKYKVTDTKSKTLYFLFIKDLVGISAIQNFFNYSKNQENVNENNNTFNYKKFIFKILNLIIMQLIILFFIFDTNLIFYIILWIYPLVGPHMFLMRIRGIAEHGLHRQKGLGYVSKSEGAYYTRSFLTSSKKYNNTFFSLLERILIGSLNVNYHHEHHLNPRIPYYNLEKFYNTYKKNIKDFVGTGVYEKGYFASVFQKNNS